MDSENEEDETMDRSTVRDPEASASGGKGKGMCFRITISDSD